MRHTYHTHGWFDFLSSAPSLIKENNVVDAWNDLIAHAQSNLSIFDVSTDSFNALPQPQRRRIVEILQDYRDFGKDNALLDAALAEFIEIEEASEIPVPIADPSTQEILAPEDSMISEQIEFPDPVQTEPTSTPKQQGTSRAAEGSSPRWVQYSVVGVYGIALIALARSISRS